jgi:hypothetical protein
MSSGALIQELLDDLTPQTRCDDCLSDELTIRPRQTVNQLCRLLAAQNRISRARATCTRCGKLKTSNSSNSSPSHAHIAPRREKEKAKLRPLRFDIEKCRTEVVQVCRELWRSSKSKDPPRSVSQLINVLRNDGLLPSHPANMMLTLCGLRNVYVYEALEFSDKELLIAKTAHEIVQDWWKALQRGHQ